MDCTADTEICQKNDKKDAKTFNMNSLVTSKPLSIFVENTEGVLIYFPILIGFIPCLNFAPIPDSFGLYPSTKSAFTPVCGIFFSYPNAQ
jgi:hypothetical protein